MRNFRELSIWQRSFDLVKGVYQFTEDLPASEKFGLTSQIRRSAVSVPSNIAEGCGRNTNKELIRFLDISLGSAFELETQLLLCQSLELAESQKVDELINELHQIQKMINGFMKTLA